MTVDTKPVEESKRKKGYELFYSIMNAKDFNRFITGAAVDFSSQFAMNPRVSHFLRDDDIVPRAASAAALEVEFMKWVKGISESYEKRISYEKEPEPKKDEPAEAAADCEKEPEPKRDELAEAVADSILAKEQPSDKVEYSSPPKLRFNLDPELADCLERALKRLQTISRNTACIEKAVQENTKVLCAQGR
jgi:hypothetical protein